MTAISKNAGRLLEMWLKAGERGRNVFILDLLSLIFSVYISYALRLTFFISGGFRADMLAVMAMYSATVLICMYAGKIYRTVWPLASVEEYARLFQYYCLAVCVFLAECFLVKSIVLPRSSAAVMLFSGIFMMTGMRASWRLLCVYHSGAANKGEKTLIIGTGEPAAIMARELMRGSSPLLPVGFIDSDPSRVGLTIASLKILGCIADVKDIIERFGVTTVLIAMPSAAPSAIRSYINELMPCGVTVRVLPSLTDIADGRVSLSRLRRISLEDLLRRDPIHLDKHELEKFIKGKTVLVTGAGGSIGSEICRQVLAENPAKLVVLGHGENSIYLLTESFADAGVTIPVVPVIADVADRETMERLMDSQRPQIIFHAAAHKHVPLMQYNPREALRVNSYGTWNLASLAGKYGVERFVMISTDKAVHPSSVMGATKRIAERLLLTVNAEYPDTAYMAVRFGNVLGSRGSVVPKFEKQIERGGPVTVTHKDMKRYFMLIPEAVSLVLQAGATGHGGSLFVLDMGEPVNITEMAETLIRLHGHEPYKEIPIVFTGVRPGEKLYEELFYDSAHVDKTSHDKIFLTRLKADETSILPDVAALLSTTAAGKMTEEELIANIFKLAC